MPRKQALGGKLHVSHSDWRLVLVTSHLRSYRLLFRVEAIGNTIRCRYDLPLKLFLGNASGSVGLVKSLGTMNKKSRSMRGENTPRGRRNLMELRCSFGADGHTDRGSFDYGIANSVEEGIERYNQFLDEDQWEVFYAHLVDVKTGVLVFDILKHIRESL